MTTLNVLGGMWCQGPDGASLPLAAERERAGAELASLGERFPARR